MRLFSCPACRLVVFFGNVACERCGAELGYDPVRNAMVARAADAPWRICANHAHGVCHWLVPEGSTDELCRACRHNLVIPDLSAPENVALWRKLEEAKHRLF